MMRRVACVGDRLSPDGVILPYDGPVFTIGDGAGHQVALIGGQAFCEACKTTGIIAKAGGPRRISFMGETAADGDIVLCKCPTHPRIIATLAGETWCDDEAESAGMASVQEAIAGTTDFPQRPSWPLTPLRPTGATSGRKLRPTPGTPALPPHRRWRIDRGANG